MHVEQMWSKPFRFSWTEAGVGVTRTALAFRSVKSADNMLTGVLYQSMFTTWGWWQVTRHARR